MSALKKVDTCKHEVGQIGYVAIVKLNLTYKDEN